MGDGELEKIIRESWGEWRKSKGTLDILEWWDEGKELLKEIIIEYSKGTSREAWKNENELRQKLEKLLKREKEGGAILKKNI